MEELHFMSKEKKDDRLNYEDVSVFMNIRDGIDIFLGGDENFPGLMDRLFETYKKGSKHHDGDKKSETFGQLDPEYEKEVKELASEVIEKIDEYEKNRAKDEAHPHAEALREGIADQIRIEAESVRDGLHLMSDDKTREKACRQDGDDQEAHRRDSAALQTQRGAGRKAAGTQHSLCRKDGAKRRTAPIRKAAGTHDAKARLAEAEAAERRNEGYARKKDGQKGWL